MMLFLLQWYGILGLLLFLWWYDSICFVRCIYFGDIFHDIPAIFAGDGWWADRCRWLECWTCMGDFMTIWSVLMRIHSAVRPFAHSSLSIVLVDFFCILFCSAWWCVFHPGDNCLLPNLEWSDACICCVPLVVPWHYFAGTFLFCSSCSTHLFSGRLRLMHWKVMFWRYHCLFHCASTVTLLSMMEVQSSVLCDVHFCLCCKYDEQARYGSSVLCINVSV